MTLRRGIQAAQQEREIRDRLLRSGVRYTRGRERVVRALQRVRGPVSAAELHESVRGDVPLSSLYRTLAVLEETGVVAPHHGVGGVTRYELAEWLSGHHHHLVCNDCGAVEDISLDREREARLEDLARRVADRSGFAAGGHTLEIEGLCRDCR